MPTTRAQSTALSQIGRPDSAEEESIAETELSGLDYDIGQLTPGSTERFHASQKADYKVVSCAEDDGDDGNFFIFEIAETNTYTVRIQEPGKKYGSLPCLPIHEGNNGVEDSACIHVFWLTDQIARHTLTGEEKDDTLTLTKLGYPSDIPHPYEQISARGIETLADEANWKIIKYKDDEDDYHRKIRANVIKEMMASLSSSELANEYRTDVFDKLANEETTEHLLVKRDLEATLAKILMERDDIYYQFRRIVSTDHRASDFFEKMRERAENTLTEMDKFFENGELGRMREAHDVVWCAQLLTNIVASIKERLLGLALGPDVKDTAAKSLVYILGEVVRRDIDSYRTPIWRNSPKRRLPENERNLYHRLINSRTGRSFILSELDLIEPSAGQYSVTELERIFETMTAAPSEYMHSFRNIISRWKSFDGPSGQKRQPGEAAGSSPKRRMK
jgi:hypothetical protein